MTLCGLPQTQDRLATIMSYGVKFLGTDSPTRKDHVQLAIYAALLKEADVDRLRNSVQTALTEDPNNYGTSDSLQRNLPTALNDYASANEAFVALLNRMADSDTKSVSVEEFL